MLLFQNGELLTKGQVFQEEVAARTAKQNEKIEQELQRTEHEPVVAEASRISMQNLLHRDNETALQMRSVSGPKGGGSNPLSSQWHEYSCSFFTCKITC
jgi:hypothetical protein